MNKVNPIDEKDKRVTIVCPLCGERELNVFHTEQELMQCIGCGYSTNKNYQFEDDKTTNYQYKNLDPSMKRWSLEANGYIWLPSILTFDSGMLYPYEDKNEKMIWAFAPGVQILPSEQHKYPRENGEGNYEFRYDIENQVTFDSFGQAIIEINLILETRRKAMEKMNEKSKTKVNLPKLKKINKDNGQKKDTN